MNLILIDPREIKDGSASLTGRRAKHIRKTLRGKEGGTIRVGIVNGLIGSGLIRRIEPGMVNLDIKTAKPPPAKTPTGLILALPRPIMLKRVLAQTASLGIERIFLINAGRVEKSFFKASLLSEEKLREYLLLGLEQAVDTVLPKISIHRRFRPFIEDNLAEISRDYPVRLAAHPGGAIKLSPALLPEPASPTLVAIGPEGGWLDFEIDRFTERGFGCFSLGPRILRVDTAVPAILAQLQLLRTLAG
ncbi:MAG: 16S rRNA (uracil(1498)-N(3))-methyltransferase [Desulfobulbales bacterium]|nr:16S rRNA (uracil(1498)-N(3))-methyltransferase [Desulfobulbales bacterium]